MTNDEDEDSPPIVKPIRKKKVKNVVPVGRNGIKKRRLVKSRVILDPQGYRGR
jgi:DNA polymerase delta subunit 3